MPGKLSIHVPEKPTIVRVIAGGQTLSLGRAADCDLVVDHHSVSRHHAELRCSGEGVCEIIDLGSKNGLRVDGQRLARAALQRSVWFAIGDVFCEYEWLDDVAAQGLQQRARTLRDSSLYLASALARETDTDKLLRELLSAMVQLAECRRGFLLTRAEVGGVQLRLCHAIAADEIASRAFSGSRGALERCLMERRPVYLSDARDAAFLRHQASVVGQGIRALAVLPLLHLGDLLGVVYVDTDDVAKVFTELDAELLEAFALRATTTLAAIQIHAELQRMEHSLGAEVGALADQIAQAARAAGGAA